MKRHNGGAGVIRCQHSTVTTENTFTFLSGKRRNAKYVTNAYNGATEIVGLDDPSTHKSAIEDLFEESIQYEFLTYGTMIVNNTFSNNYSGKRGTALLIELVNELKIAENKFMSNGPVQTYAEIEHSPFYKHFLYNERTLTYYLLDKETLGDCKDEASWLNQCYLDGKAIDMP